MGKPKRQHFIPQVVLRQFAGNSEQMWFHRPEFAPGDVRLTSIKNLFVEGHSNTITRSDGTLDFTIEENFAYIESVAGEFFPQIAEAARSGVAPILSPNAWRFWHHYFHAQWRRPPALMARLSPLVDVDSEITRSIDELIASGEFDATTGEQLKSPSAMELHRRNAMAAARGLAPDGKMASFLAHFGMSIFVIPPRLRRSFVVGDVAIARPTSKSPLFLPIAPDLAIGVTDRLDEVAILPLVDRDHVKWMNLAMARQSTTVAASDRDLLLSIVRHR